MKKILFSIILMLGASVVFSQKYALVDTDYILKNIPSYKAAQDKLDDLSEEWQKEIEEKKENLDEIYKDYQSEKVLLSEEMQKKREEEIVKKEEDLRALQKKYFGPKGKLFEKRKELVKPIQDEVANAVKQVAEKGNYAVIFDTASGMNMIYTDPKYDKSDEVLEILGYN